MKNIIRFSINNKFAILIMTVIVVVAGMYAGTTMKQETIPNLELPILTVVDVYPGATPDEVVEKITTPLEQRIKNLNSVDTVNSTSMENAASIIVQYKYGKDMSKAETELKEAIADFTPPTGAQATQVSKISFNSFPVVSLSISGDNLEDITKLVENEIKPNLEGIDGAGTVSISGQQEKEVRLTFKEEKMKALGLSEDTVKGIIQGSAVKASLGMFTLGKSEQSIVVDGSVTTLDDLKNIAIPVMPTVAGAGAGAAIGAGNAAGAGMGNAAGAGAGAAAGAGNAAGAGAGAAAGAGNAAGAGAGAGANLAAGLPTVKLADVADVELVTKSDSISRTNGQDSIGINITKSSDANTVKLVNEAKKQAKQVEKDHPGVKAIVMLDQGKPIEESVSTMLNKALFGALFAIIVIMLFLRNLRTTIISVVSIPLSLLIALFVLKQLDVSLNIMTLGAMTVAIGRVVDDSIVVIENNFRRMSMSSEKLKGRALIVDATREMFTPILSSTLVTIAVFLPLALVSGMVGELFLPFAETMVIALLASLLVAVTVVPTMAHLTFRKGLKKKHSHEEGTGASSRYYRRILNWTLNHKAITSIIAVVLLVGSLFLSSVVGVSFLPEEEQKYALVTYKPAPGTLFDDAAKTAEQADAMIRAREGVMNLQYSVGGSGMGGMMGGMMGVGGGNSGLFYVQYKDDVKNFKQEKTNLVEDLKKIDSAGEWSQLDMSAGIGGSQLTLSVYGNNMEDIQKAAGQVQDLLKQNKNLEKVDTSLSETFGQYTLKANQEKLSKLGLTAGQIAMALMPAQGETALTNVIADNKEYPVYVNTKTASYSGISDIQNLPLTSPLGMQVPIKDVTTTEEGTAPTTITQKDGRMYADVTADVTAKDVSKVSSAVQDELDKMQFPDGVTVEIGGVTEQINETFTQLGLAMAAAIAIVYLLLVITFGGALTPFAILFSLPFIVIGALVGLYVAGETISASAMMGALMLIGIVVTNAIVLLDRVLHKEKKDSVPGKRCWKQPAPACGQS